MNKLSTIGLLAVALCGCQRPSAQTEELAPASLAKGQIVRYDLTYDALNHRPRMRWIVQLAYPLRMAGLDEQDYAQVKVFGLSDTTTFRVGTKFVFTYQTVPDARQTPWLTTYEWNAAESVSSGYAANPELIVDNVQVR
ncbi:hypothetical protein [Hymenobacter rubidus]|uniref:hypothetical protein n=1 Tax=Hymenobacter rubidus TaxID=1441626 RepID=UPI00191F489C|nr:hypothetical protein [Hymenobacter rubidus]